MVRLASFLLEAFPIMNSLAQARILLGVSGGIAAYKTALLARLLIKAGAEVRVVMTAGAQAFIQPLTFQALTGHAVHTELLDAEAEAGMGHIELARWANLVLLAPASANLLARLAQGQADDLLTTLCLATAAPVYLAPAMNQQMWAHPATQANCQRLQEFGYQLIPPEAGEQACGDVGLGRLPEPEALLAALEAAWSQRSSAVAPLGAGLRFLITAGPTQEALDPVRYLSNHSSGKMGFALASAAQALGAQVTLVAGPVHLPTPAGVERINVLSANEMLAACQAHQAQSDLFIACAAVADYRMATPAEQKIKKTSAETLTLELIKNPDILATLAASSPRPFCIGFAAETQQVLEYAQQKLIRKNLDAIVANDVSDPSIGFGSDQNRVTLLWQDQQHQLQQQDWPATQKATLAHQLIARLITLYQEQRSISPPKINTP